RECLDHVIVFGEAHLRRILGRYAAYYNESRIHRSLDKAHSTGRLIASASSHHSLSSAAFITNIAESDFRHAQASWMSKRATLPSRRRKTCPTVLSLSPCVCPWSGLPSRSRTDCRTSAMIAHPQFDESSQARRAD